MVSYELAYGGNLKEFNMANCEAARTLGHIDLLI